MIPAAAQLGAHYSGLKTPLSIFAGADDKVVDPKAHSVRLHRAIPGSTLLVAPGAGHMVHYAIPAEIADATQRMSEGAEDELTNSDAAVDETSTTGEKLPDTPAQA